MSENQDITLPVRRGKLQIFLGYAAGVGKTYQMLNAARKLKEQGRDVVIGYFEPHARLETIAQTEGLEFVPRRVSQWRGAAFEDMDTEGVIARRPEVAVVDEFAHTNVPGSERGKRWQDVALILDSGIDVLTSLNVQHIESLNDQVLQVTGIRVRETIPDWVVREASEVVMVDVTPRALLHRLVRGVVYAPEKAAQALENFFTESNLISLRELAIRQTAQQLDGHQLKDRAEAASGTGTDRILIWLTEHPSTAMLIRRGRRVADYLGAPCMAVQIRNGTETAEAERHVNFCRNLRIETEVIDDKKAAGGGEQAVAVADCARRNGITQLFVTRHAPGLRSLVQRARDIQIIIVADRIAERARPV